jgi:hypothetical protein
MKKLALVIAMMLGTTAYAGEFANVEYTPNKSYSGGIKSDVVDLTIGTTVGNWAIDAKGSTERADVAKTYQNNAQGRATYDFGPVYVRGGLGRQFVQGGNDYNFVTYAVGSSYVVTKGAAIVGEYERSNALSAGNPKFNKYTLGATYDLSSKNTVGASWIVTNGDVQSHGVGLSLGRKF